MDDRIRVLLADDHRLFAQSLSLMLELDQSIEVVATASDGAEAVALAGLLDPEVVVMDLDMPVLDGIEATVALQRSAPRVKVVIVTGSTEPADEERARAAGATAYVSKDASVEELRRTVCEIASPACLRRGA